jgi:hypothetical protein
MDCLGAEAYSNRCLLNKNGLTFVAFLLIFSLPYAMYIFFFFFLLFFMGVSPGRNKKGLRVRK